MENLMRTIFTPGNFEPHNFHFLPNHVELMWFLIIGNIAIAILYAAMPIQLLYVYFKRKDFPFRWIFFAIPLFGVWCSITHIVMVISFWYPLYYLQAIVDFITGIVSFGTFVALVPAAYQAHSLSSPETLSKENDRLRYEIESHKYIKERLAHKNKELSKISEVLQEKKEALSRLNKKMTDQELRMIELKKEIAILKNI